MPRGTRTTSNTLLLRQNIMDIIDTTEPAALHMTPAEADAIAPASPPAPSVARDMVHEVMADPQLALETHAREELGINLDNLGSPVQSALSSFVTFAFGAFLPLLPWLITKGNGALVASVLLSTLAALAIGAVLAAFTERPMVRSALRQLVITAGAAAVTYGVGRAIGTGLG